MHHQRGSNHAPEATHRMSNADATPSLWAQLRTTVIPVEGLDRERVPSTPGILALYRDDRLVWMGKSANLRATVAQAHALHGPSAVSPLRRNVAAFLDLSTPAAIAAGRFKPSAEDQARISQWIRECSLGWLACASESETMTIESRLAAERV
jgi:hypothetical protein